MRLEVNDCWLAVLLLCTCCFDFVMSGLVLNCPAAKSHGLAAAMHGLEDSNLQP